MHQPEEQLNFANQDLRNSCFNSAYLRDANFKCSDIRGCDFTNANLIGANFERAKAGYTYKQIIKLILFITVFTIASIESIAFVTTGRILIAVAISLALSVIGVLISRSPVGLVFAIVVAISGNVSGNPDFAVAIALAFGFSVVLMGSWEMCINFAVTTSLCLSIACIAGFAGNLGQALATPLVLPISCNFGGILTFILADSTVGSSSHRLLNKLAIATTTSQNLLLFSIFAGRLANYDLNNSNLNFSIFYGILSLVAAIAAIYTGLIGLKILKSTPGTSFRQADLTNTNFSHASLPHTDFYGAKLFGAVWYRAQFKKRE